MKKIAMILCVAAVLSCGAFAGSKNSDSKTAGETVDETITAIQNELSEIKDKASEKTKEISKQAKKDTKELKKSADEKTEDLKKKASKKTKKAKKDLEKAKKQAGKAVDDIKGIFTEE